MIRFNKTFQRLRREHRMSLEYISKKCKISKKRIAELDEDAAFTNIELAKICDALGITIDTFYKEIELTNLDSPYLIKVRIDGNQEGSELYEAISDTENDIMNNQYDTERHGWKHNSFNEAVIVLENARNYLSSLGYVPPTYRREGYLFAILSYLNDNAYIEGKTTVGIRIGSVDLYDPMDYDPLDDFDDPFDDFDSRHDYYDDDLY